jgi:hypothetical protein
MKSFYINKNGTIPHYLSPAESTKFQTRFDPFEVRNGHLFYQDLEVVPRDQINQKLEQIYADNTTHFNGIVAFYKYVSSKYINIKRIDVQKFLQDQANCIKISLLTLSIMTWPLAGVFN